MFRIVACKCQMKFVIIPTDLHILNTCPLKCMSFVSPHAGVQCSKGTEKKIFNHVYLNETDQSKVMVFLLTKCLSSVC